MRWLLIVPLLFLFGCGASTTGKNICPETNITVTDSYYVTISPGLETLSGDTELDVDAPYDIRPDVPIDLTLSPTEVLEQAVSQVANAAVLKKAEEITAEVPVLTPDKEKVIVTPDDEQVFVPETEAGVLEEARFHGRNSENNRPVWYFSKEMKAYPAGFSIIVEDCGELVIQGNTGKRIDFDESRKVVPENQSRDRWFVAQSEVPGRGMVVVAPRGCLSEKAYIPKK